MLERFGPNKIIDTPISEAAFSGLAVGAAMMGMRPVVEFMFWSFAMWPSIKSLIMQAFDICLVG